MLHLNKQTSNNDGMCVPYFGQSLSGDLFYCTVMIQSTDMPGQTVQTQIRLPRNSLIRVYTVCHSVCIVWTHYPMVEPHSSNFLGVRIFRKFTVYPQIPDYRNAVIVARNPNSVKRATSYAERLRLRIAVIHGEEKEDESEKFDGRNSPPLPASPVIQEADFGLQTVPGTELWFIFFILILMQVSNISRQKPWNCIQCVIYFHFTYQ